MFIQFKTRTYIESSPVRFRRNLMISVIIPAYNEADNINIIAKCVSEQLAEIGDYEILFIDDGSTDETLDQVKKLSKNGDNIKYISFSRNFGHQKALKAGLDNALGDCVITIDADMRHPPELMKEMIDRWKEGVDVVYTIREDSADTSFIKRTTSKLFYNIINKISDVDIPLGAADFRLLDRKVVNELKKFQENWLFIRGIVSWLGFKQSGIRYKVQRRHSGHSKYSMRKMIGFAIQGITSFSVLPLRVSIFLGFMFSLFSFLYAIYAIYAKFVLNAAILGWTSILMSVLFLGGIQLIFLGILGEYLGKMFIETKNRPNYIIREKNI